MDRLRNELFQLLKFKDGRDFPAETVANLYKARRYVLKHIKEWEGSGIGPRSNYFLHVVLDGDDPLMLSIVRQIALLAHYANFDESKSHTHSTITILYENVLTVDELKLKIDELSKEEYLYNLIKYSKYTLYPPQEEPWHNDGALPFLDIDFELRSARDFKGCSTGYRLPSKEIIKSEIENYELPMQIDASDVNKASLVNLAYYIGKDIDNLPSTDNNSAKRYSTALDCFNRIITPEKRLRKWNKPFINNDKESVTVSQTALRNMLSCIFSADTFESRIRGLMQTKENVGSKAYLLTNWNDIRNAISKNLKELAQSEHARWNAEKLILGFRPMTDEECYTDECNVRGRKEYRDSLKKRADDPSHIDLVSYSDLRRINPQDMKYDCFIIIAMPSILRKQYYKPSPWVRVKRKLGFND